MYGDVGIAEQHKQAGMQFSIQPHLTYLSHYTCIMWKESISKMGLYAELFSAIIPALFPFCCSAIYF